MNKHVVNIASAGLRRLWEGITIKVLKWPDLGPTKISETNMTTTNATVKDKRRLLKIKLKSLATEAAIIRKEEDKTKHSKRPEVQELRQEMHQHRVWDLRMESRATGLAYSFIRGRKYRQIEPRSSLTATDAAWILIMKPKIHAMITKYGSQKIPGEFLDQWLMAEPQHEKPPRKPKLPYTGPKGAPVNVQTLPVI